MYGDKIALGVTDEAVLAYFKQPANKKILDFRNFFQIIVEIF